MTDLKHIYVNFKRFDVPSELGGVNRLASARDYSKTIVSTVREELASFSGCEFVHFYPESQIPEAVRAAEGSVLRSDVRECTGTMSCPAATSGPSRPSVLPPQWPPSGAPIR